MTEDQATRARVAGRQAKEGATLWRLEVGSLALRCVRKDGGRGVVEVRNAEGQWVAMPKMEGDPLMLLQRFAISTTVARALGGGS